MYALGYTGVGSSVSRLLSWRLRNPKMLDALVYSMERFGNLSLLALEISIAKNVKRLISRKFGAGDGDRTRDVQLGKLAFYR